MITITKHQKNGCARAEKHQQRNAILTENEAGQDIREPNYDPEEEDESKAVSETDNEGSAGESHTSSYQYLLPPEPVLKRKRVDVEGASPRVFFIVYISTAQYNLFFLCEIKNLP